MSKTKGQLAPEKVEAPKNPVDLNSIPDDVIARKYDEVRAANPTLSNDDVARRTRDLLTGRSASAPAGTGRQGGSSGDALDPAFAAAFQDWGRQARLNAPVYSGQQETYQKAYRELYDRLTGATYQERGAQLQALKDAFTPRREVTYIDPQKEMARLAGMNVDPRVTVRNYDPENPDGRLQLFVPEGARVLNDKTYDDEDHYSPRVKAEMLRQERNRKRYWNNKMRESIAVARGEESFPSLAPEAIKPEGKRKTVGWLDKIIEGGDEAFDILTGLTANPVDVTRYGLARLSNLAGLTDTPEEQFDESWRMLRGRAERGVKAVTNPETPGEMLFSLGVDALTTYLTVGGSQAVTGLNTTRTLGTAAKTLAGGAMTNLGTSTMIDAVKKGYYDPVARGKRTFSPREARDYLQDTYGVYAGSLSDDEAQKLARAMNNQMADATFNLNPYGMGDKHPVLQGIMYGLDAGAGMLGGAGNFDGKQEQETITQIAPKLFDLQAQANTLESANFPKDVHDLLELVAQGEAKRKSMPEAAKWAEQITAALPFMYRLIQEQKMLGAAGEINLKLGLKRLMRDATELLRSPEKSAALKRLGTALFADGPETLGKIMVRSYAGALTEGITPIARDGQYLYGKMIEDGASPGEAFFGSYFTGLTGRAFERISESGLVPLGQFGNALSKSFFRRAGTNIFRRAFGEYGEEAATDVATYLTEEGANVPEAYRQQPFRPIMLGGGFAEAMDGNFQNEAFMQALGEFVVSAGIGAIMGTARLASRPFQTMHGGIQALQNGGHFMSYVDRGLREKQGWTEDKIRSTPAIDRATEYYAAKYNLPDVKKERLRQAIELNVAGKGASALAETIARDYDAFFRLHGGVGSFEKLREEMAQDRETEEMSWFWKPEARKTAADINVAQDTKEPVAEDPHVEEARRMEAMREAVRTMPTPEMNSEADQTAFTRPRATGPREMFPAPSRMESSNTGVIAEPEATAEDVSGVAAYFGEKALVRKRKLLKKEEHATAITKISRVVEKGIAAEKSPDEIIEDVYATGLRFRDKSAPDVLRAFIGMKYKGETVATFEDAVRAVRPEGAPAAPAAPAPPADTRSLAEQNVEIRARIAERDALARELEAFDQRLAAERAGSTPAVQPEPELSAPGEATGVDALSAEGMQMEMFDPEPVVPAHEAAAADQARHTDEAGRRWYSGPRGGIYYIRPDGRKVRSKAVPAGVTPRDSRLPEEELLPAEPLVPPTIAEPPATEPTATPAPAKDASSTAEEMPDLVDLTDDAGRVIVIDPSVPRDESGRVLPPPSLETEFDLQKGVPTRKVGKGRAQAHRQQESSSRRKERQQAEVRQVEQQIRENPDMAKRLLRRFRAMFPWIHVENIENLTAADGSPVYGASSRLAYWIGLDLAQGRLDTIPHEYGHQFVRMFRGHDLVEAGITQYGSEEALVERMGKEAVARADDGFMVSWMKDFTQTVREVFTRAERDYARELSRQLYKGNRTMTQQTVAERFMHGRANITPTNRDILMREAHLGRLQEGVDFQSGAPTVGAAEAAVRDHQTAAAPPPRTKAPDQSRPTTTTFEGAIEEHTRPGRALATHIKAQTGVEMPPMSDADVFNILELPSPRAAIEAIMQHVGQSDKRVRDVVHRWVARNWDRRDFPKIDVWIDTDESGKTGFRVDVNQSVIERDESGRVTNVNLGTYTNDKGNRLVTWETEPLLVKMAHVAEFFEKMGLTPRKGASNLVSRINTIGTTSKETFDYTELGTLAGEHSYTYARMADHLAREGFILIGPPGKNDSFVVLNVDMTAQMPITPAVFTAYAQALDQYEKYMDRSKPGWRETPSGKQHLQMRRGLTEGYALDQNGQLTPDIAKLNGLMTLTQKRQALQTAFLTWSMGPEWPSKGIKVFKYLNTLAAAEQQSIAEFADEAVREAAGKAMEEYRKTLPADQQGVHLRAQNGLTEIVAPNVSQEEIAKGDHKKDWNLAALLATKGYTLTKGGVAFKMKDGELVSGSVRMVMAIADHDTYLNGVPLGDGSSLISPAASVVQDRAHGDPNGDVKFHKVRMFIPWRGSKPPLLWKGQFDVAAGTVLDVMERNGIGLVVFDSTVKVGKESRARKHKDPKDKPVFQNITDLVKEGAYGNMAGTDWYLVDPAVISKANDATSKPGHTTSLVTQLLYANAISPIVSEKWAGVYETLRRTVARLSRSTRDFLYEVHASPSLLRAVYERGEEDEHSSEPEQVLRAMLRADKGRTPALTALPHWRAATNSASIRTVLEQLFDDQGSMRVIGQGAFLRADNGTLDGVNIAAIIEAGGVEAAMKYCNITEILPYGEQGVDPEMHEEIMRKMWQEENAERHKGTKVTKLLEDQLQEWRSYSDEAFRAMILSRGWGIVEAGGKRYMIKGDGRLKARVDGAVPVVVAYNKAKKMGLGVGDKMMAVAYPTDAPHNAQSCVIVGVSKGVNDWMSYSSEVVQKLGKDHDGDKLSLYGPSAGYWRREVARLEGELKASALKGRDEEAMEDIQREIDLARARARHGFQELPQEAFDAVWNHYASDDVQEYVKGLYKKAGIDGPFDDAAVAFIRNTVTTFVDPWQRAIDKENARRAKKGEPPLTPAEIAREDKYQNPYPYSIFSAKGDAMLMKDYVGKTGDLIAYVAGTRNKIEYMIQNFRAIAESTGRIPEDIDAMEQRLRTPDESGLSPLDKIAVVGSLLTHHAVDAPKEEAIFGYGFSAGAYYKWARETLGFTKEETEPFERQYKLLREAMKGTIQDDNGVYMVDQHEQGKKAIPEARLTALQLAHRQRAMLGAESLMDMLANGFMELGDLSMPAEVYQTKVLPRIVDRLSQKLGLTSTFGPVDKEGTPHLFTSQSRTRELTEAERASTLGALRQGVRDRDGRAREVAFALLQAQAYNDFATSGYRPGERHGLDETVKKYVEMLDVNHRRNPLFVVLPEFVRNVAGHLAKMKTPTIETEHYTIDRVRGIIDKTTGAQITPERITAMLTARTAEDVHAVKKNANQIWNMIKEVSTGFWQNTGKDVVSQDDWGNEVTTHYGTKLPILTGAQSQRLVRETMDAVLRDQNGMPVEGRYENIARVLLNNELPFRMIFRHVHRSNEHLAKDRLDLDTYAPEGVNHYFTTRQFGNTVNPPSYQITSYGSIAAENHLNLAGFGYMTPEMQETFMEGLRESPEAARALHRITPVQGEDIDADILAVESTDALRRKAERAERAIRYLYPKVKELVGMTNPNMITSGMYREAATEVRELFAKAVADYTAIKDEVPGVFGPKEQALIAAQLDKLSGNIELLQDEKFDEMARRAAEFDFQTSQEGQEIAREYRGLLRQMGRVVGLMGEWFRLARANGLFSFMAPYTVAGKIGTIQPTRKRTGAERIGPTLLFRLATPDKQRSPKIHSNLVSDLAMYTSRGVMRDELGGEEFGDVDLAHAMIRATAEKITSDESAVQAALDRILAPLAQLQDQYPDEWVRMNQMLLEELHRGTRFPVKIVFGEKVWSWQFPDGSTASTEIDQLPIGDLRGIVEKHFGKAVTELAGKKATAEEREAALTQAAHLLKMTMQLRKFIAQNNYMLFAESVRIKQHRLAHTPNLSFQERKSLEKQIESDRGLQWRIASGEFYFPLFYRPEYFEGNISKETRRGSEDAFTDLLLNTASARQAKNLAGKENRAEMIRDIHLNTARAFIQRAVSPEMYEAILTRGEEMNESERLSYFREEMASILRGSDNYFGVPDVKRDAHTLSGGLGMNAFDAHTMQRAVDIDLLMNPAVAHAISLPRPALDYLDQNVGSSVQRMMNNHLNALLGNVAKAVQAQYIDPMRGNPIYDGTLRNWDRFMNGVLRQKNFTQRLELSQLIAGEDVMLDVMEARDEYDPETSEMVAAQRRVTVRMTYRGTRVTPDGKRYIFTFSSNGMPAEMSIAAKDLAIRVRHYDKTGEIKTERKRDWTYTDMRSYVRDQGRWMEALARKNPERWAGLYTHVAPYWKWVWDTMSTLGGVFKLGWNPISAVNNVLYQVKTTAWRIGTPEYRAIDKLLKSNDPSLEKEIKEILYALPVYNWEFIANKVSEGTGYEQSSYRAVLQSVLLYNDARSAAEREARQKGLVGLQEETFVTQTTMEKWQQAMLNMGFKLAQMQAGMGTTSELVDAVRHSSEVRKAVKAQALDLAYRMFQVTEQMNRAMATTTAWNKTRGWQEQQYRLFDTAPVKVGNITVDVRGGGLSFDDLPRALKQRILRTQGIYARMQDEAVNYDYSNIMRPPWLRQPLAQFAFKFGIFTMASYVHRTRELGRLMRDRGQKRYSKGKEVSLKTHLSTRKTVALDRTIAFDPSMVTEAEWMTIMEKIAPTALGNAAAVAKVKAEVVAYLKERGITLEASQLDPVWNAQKYLMVNLVDKVVKSWITLGLVVEPASVFFWSVLDLMGNLTGWADDDDEIQADPVVQALKADQLRKNTSDISRNGPIPGGLLFSNLLATIMKWAVLSKVEPDRGLGDYIGEYFKDDMNFLRDPSFRMLTNLVASYIPALRTGADIAALAGLTDGKPEFGDPTSLGELLGRWVDVGKKDYMEEKYDSERENVREMIHKAARTGKGYNPFKRTAEANLVILRQQAGRADQQMFRSNAAGGGRTDVGEFEVALEGDKSEMLWLERIRLGEGDKAYESLVDLYLNRMIKETEKERMVTDEDMNLYADKAIETAARRVEEWKTRMEALGIGQDLRGVDEMVGAVEQAVDSVSEQ